MRRAELEHLVRAACELTGDDEIIVIGSQAIHASIPEERLPRATTLSNEADLWPIGAEDEAEDRLVRFESANTNGKVGLCLERHDLCIAKLVAGREKDLAFIDSLLRVRRLNEVTLVERLGSLNLAGELRQMVHARLAALTGLDVEDILGDLST